MRTERRGRFTRVVLHPGEYYANKGATTITTLLGSCVAACLYDPRQRIIGMNHFMLSNPRYSRTLPFTESEAGRYGVQAMELLINAMMKLGADRRMLHAKAFGGATLFGNDEGVGTFMCVGQVNCRFIKEFLSNEGIPLVSRNLGGDHGQVIHFVNGDFSVYRRRVDGNRSHQLGLRDQDCWQRAIDAQKASMPEIDLW